MEKKPKIVEFYGGKVDDDYYELVSVFKYDEETRTYYMMVEFDFEKAYEKEVVFQRASDGKLLERIETEDEEGNVIWYVPPKNIPFEVSYAFEREDEVISNRELFGQIRDFIKKYVYLEDERLYTVLAAWILHTWIYEFSPTTAYLHFLGPKESGKTRALETLAKIAYHSYLSASLTPAVVARDIEQKHVTLFFDEYEYKRLKESELLPIVLNGYKKEGLYARALGESGDEVKYFNVFCPKAFTSRTEYEDMLESRCITIPMQKAVSDYPIMIDPIEASIIRAWCWLFRRKFLAKMGKIRLKQVVWETRSGRLALPDRNLYAPELEEVTQNLSKSDSKGKKVSSPKMQFYAPELADITFSDSMTVFQGGKDIYNKEEPYPYFPDTVITVASVTKLIVPELREDVGKIKGRLFELFLPIITPILALELDGEIQKEIVSFFVNYAGKKMEREAMTIEAEIVEAVVKYWNENREFPSSGEIASLINEERAESEKISAVWVGRIMGSLGFEQSRIGSKRLWKIDSTHLKKLCDRYGVEFHEPTENEEVISDGKN